MSEIWRGRELVIEKDCRRKLLELNRSSFFKTLLNLVTMFH